MPPEVFRNDFGLLTGGMLSLPYKQFDRFYKS